MTMDGVFDQDVPPSSQGVALHAHHGQLHSAEEMDWQRDSDMLT